MDNATNTSTINVSDAIRNFRYVGITIGIISIILGSVGNLLTILVFSRSAKLQLSFNAFVVSLAAIDFLTASFMLPFNVAGYTQMQWPIGGADNFTASIQAFVYFCCGYTSITCLMAITFNRFISIRHPNRYKILFRSLFTKRRMVVAVVASWLIAPAFFLPVLFGNTGDGKRIIGWNSGQLLCTFIHIDGTWKTYMQILRVIFQFLPILLMVSAYTAMFMRLRRKDDEKNAAQLQLPWEVDKDTLMAQTPGLSANEAQIAQNMKAKEKRNTEVRLLVVSATLCLVFILLFLPSLVVNLLPGRANFDPRIHMAASNITWLNCCVNPFIYAIANPKFRVEYKILIYYIWFKATCRI